MTRALVRQALLLLADRTTDVGALCQPLGVSRSALYSYVGPGGQTRRMPEC